MPEVSPENWKIVKQIYSVNENLPRLPPELWMIIFDIRDAMINYENNLPMDTKWRMGWRPDNYPYKTDNWIEEGKLNYWLSMSFLKKILWKFGIINVSKLEYWDNIPSWFSIVFNNYEV